MPSRFQCMIRFGALLDSFRSIAEGIQGHGAATTILMIFFRNVSAVAISLLWEPYWETFR
jgi:hypothetical protein